MVALLGALCLGGCQRAAPNDWLTQVNQSAKLKTHPLRLQMQLEHTRAVKDLAYSPNGEHFVSASADTTLRLWDAETTKLIRILKGHTHSIESVAYSPDGKQIATASMDGTIRVWDPQKTESIQTWKWSDADDSRDAQMNSSSVLDLLSYPGETTHFCNHLRIGYTDDGNIIELVPSKRADDDYWRCVLEEPKRWDLRSKTKDQIEANRLDNPAAQECHKTNPEKNLSEFKLLDTTLSPANPNHLIGVIAHKADYPYKVVDLEACEEIEIKPDDVGDDHPELILSVAISPDGNTITIGAWDGTIELWDASTHSRTHATQGNPISFGRGRIPHSVTVLFGENLLVANPNGRTISLLDLTSGQPMHTFSGRYIALSQDQKSLGIAEASTISLWSISDPSSPKSAAPSKLSAKGYTVGPIKFTPDAKQVLFPRNTSTRSSDNLWNLDSDKLVDLPIGGLSSFEFSTSNHLLTVDETGISVWEWSNDTIDRIHRCDYAKECHIDRRRPYKRVDLQSAFDGNPKQTDAPSGCDTKCWEYRNSIHIDEKNILTLTSSPNKTLPQFASAGEDGTIKIWDTQKREERKSINSGHSGLITNLTYSPDGTRLLSSSRDKTLKLWSVADGRLLKTFEGHATAVLDAAFHPNGEYIVSTSLDTTMRIWDTKTGNHLLTMHIGPDKAWAATTPDGHFELSKGLDKLHFVIDETNDIVEFNQLHGDLDEELESRRKANLMKLVFNGELAQTTNKALQAALPPKVTVAKSDDTSLRHSFKLLPQQGGVGKVRVSLNKEVIIEDARELMTGDILRLDLSPFKGKLSESQDNTLHIQPFNHNDTVLGRGIKVTVIEPGFF